MAKVYVFSRNSQNFLLKVVKSDEEDINNKKRGLSPLFLWRITPPELLTTFNRNFWELREKTYTFANESY